MELDDEDLHQVLARAQEIQRTALTGPAARAELEVVIQAAEEVGIPRAAVERALRERFNLPAQPPRPGELFYARSADGKYYVAEVLAATADDVRIRFLNGSKDHSVAVTELRPAGFLPGEKVTVNWPWWGPWTCTVVSFDAEKGRVKVNDGWGETRTFPIAEVWLNAPKVPAPGRNRARIYATLLGAGAGAGAIIGSIITALLLR